MSSHIHWTFITARFFSSIKRTQIDSGKFYNQFNKNFQQVNVTRRVNITQELICQLVHKNLSSFATIYHSSFSKFFKMTLNESGHN